MAQYKVPQDVEADDKLIGPFGFRQFFYIVIAFLLGGGCYAIVAGIGIENAVSWLIILLFIPPCGFLIILALPRKDQPMETYVAALIKFYFKPHLRIWDADGIQNMIEISVPVIDDAPKTKDFDADEARRRLSELSDITDSQGQSTRKPINNNLVEEFVTSTTGATDILSQDDSLGQEIETKLLESEHKTRQEALEWMKYNKDHSPLEDEAESQSEGSMQSVFSSPSPEETPQAEVAEPAAVAPEPTPVPKPAAPLEQSIKSDLPPREIEIEEDTEPESIIPPEPIDQVDEKSEKSDIIESDSAKSTEDVADTEEIIEYDDIDGGKEVEIDLR